MNEWKKSMLERGVVIGTKDKENFKKQHDKIAEVGISLPNGETALLVYSKGQNLNYIASEFCMKHKLPPDYHEKVVKSVVKAINGVVTQ